MSPLRVRLARLSSGDDVELKKYVHILDSVSVRRLDCGTLTPYLSEGMTVPCFSQGVCVLKAEHKTLAERPFACHGLV